jgi:S-adenosylmethionine-dependent methyltransferase
MMNTPPSVFDDSIDRWLAENDLPWMKLKTGIGLSNLRKHLPKKTLRILDAGGGSGMDSIPLAREGHEMDLADYSQEMLKAAGVNAERERVAGRIRFHNADVSQLDQTFAQPQFDAVLCHNVLQYVADVPKLLSMLSAVLLPGGILSLISPNRFSLPYATAFLEKDLDKALLQIDARAYKNRMFHAMVTEYSAGEIRTMLPDTGLVYDADYGIRCLSDYWGDNETKSKPENWEKLTKLEYALTDKFPYILLARFLADGSPQNVDFENDLAFQREVPSFLVHCAGGLSIRDRIYIIPSPMYLISQPPATRYDLRFTLLGVPVRVHPLFWLITALLGATAGNLIGVLIWVPAVFLSILLHELGHALTMRRFGQVPQIVLHYGGGLTTAEPFYWGNRPVVVPLTPGQEILISLAGSGTGFLLASLVIGMVAAAGGSVGANLWLGFLPLPFVGFSARFPLAALIANTFLWINIFWGVINLLPVLPLDGGNVARVLFVRSDPWNGVRNSLRLSAAAGAVAAVVGLVLLANPFLAMLFGFLAFQSYQLLHGGGIAA